LGEKLDQQVKTVADQRAKAIELLNSAFAHYDAASGFAKTLTTKLTALAGNRDAAKLPERHAWQELIAINSPAVLDLRKAAVQSRLARIFADQFAELRQRNRLATMLTPVLKQSGLTVPQSLTTALPVGAPVAAELETQLKGIEGDLKADTHPFATDASGLTKLAEGQTSLPALQSISATQADLAYAWSAWLLGDAINQAGQGDLAAFLGNVAHAALMADYYGSAQFSLLQGKQQDADASLKSAVGERDAVDTASARYLLPTALPPGLAFPVAAVVAQPAPVPASAPAVTPAEGTAPPATPPATTPATTPPADGSTPPATPPTTAPADATTPPATPPATAPADGTTPPPTPSVPPPAPADGATPPATPPATTPPATPPADGTTPPAPPPVPPPTAPPADGTTPPPAPAPTTPPAQ
jgi:hypothetical protein